MRVITSDFLGHPTDIEITERREGDELILTITTVLPQIIADRQGFQSIAPPRWPWKGVKEKEI